MYSVRGVGFPGAHLSIDTHSIRNESQTGTRVRNPVNDNKAVKADAHATIDATALATNSGARGKPLLRDDHRSHGFTYLCRDGLVIKNNDNRFASSNAGAISKWYATTRIECHA
jgi:hypothetical protein